MATRRQMLLAAAAASLAPRFALAKASQPATAVNFEVPVGACDCHTHIHVQSLPRDPERGSSDLQFASREVPQEGSHGLVGP